MAPGNAGQSGQSTDTDVETSDQDAEAGYQAILASYDGLVLGHLAKFKTFPPAARMREEEGDVGVEFVIDRGGKLLDCRLLESSGSRRLDKAALSQLRESVRNLIGRELCACVHQVARFRKLKRGSIG